MDYATLAVFAKEHKCESLAKWATGQTLMARILDSITLGNEKGALNLFRNRTVGEILPLSLLEAAADRNMTLLLNEILSSGLFQNAHIYKTKVEQAKREVEQVPIIAPQTSATEALKEPAKKASEETSGKQGEIKIEFSGAGGGGGGSIPLGTWHYQGIGTEVSGKPAIPDVTRESAKCGCATCSPSRIKMHV